MDIRPDVRFNLTPDQLSLLRLICLCFRTYMILSHLYRSVGVQLANALADGNLAGSLGEVVNLFDFLEAYDHCIHTA